MDFSINSTNKYNKGNRKINFKGVKGAYLPDNTSVLRFNPPPYKKDKEKVYLEVAMLRRNLETDNFYSPEKEDISEIQFYTDKPIEIRQQELAKHVYAIGYRYKIVDKKSGKERYETDGFKTIDAKDGHPMNILHLDEYGYGITPKTGAMRHSFLDSDAIMTKDNKLMPYNDDFVRNHFNVLKGSTKGLLYLLTNTKELDPYTWIMSTPDIGADKTSSHRYWPNNLYQCIDLETFKKFNFELFKQGKGYVADGAFTSQSLQSPIAQHVFKWGKDSPFYNMLKIDGRINLGILPNPSPNSEVNPYDYIGIKMVNSPSFPSYNSDKPTYIQFYDSRLASKEQLDDDELIDVYDIKDTNDHYDIITHQDSIQPFYFEISPDDKRIDVFKEHSHILLKDIPAIGDFLTFPHYTITDKEHSSGASFWDGNRDLIKMNLSNPSIYEGNYEGCQNARKYILGVATYWTEAIQNDLIFNILKLSDEEKRKVALKNGISNNDYETLLSLNNIESPIIKQNKTVEEYIREFPLQSIETSPEMSAIFAEPQFNKEFLDDETYQKIEKMVSGIINNVVPQAYKTSDRYFKYVTKLFSNQIIRQLLINAINPEAVKDDGSIDMNVLKKTNIKSFVKNPATVEDERKAVIDKIRKGLDDIKTISLETKISSYLSNITLKDFELAESIVLQGKGGLNWRFDAVKDIGDLDSVREGTNTFDFIWNGDEISPGVEDFWSEFIRNIHKYNPSSYIIAEITSLGDFYKYGDMDSAMAFDSKLAKGFAKKTPEQKNTWEEHVVYALERRFHERAHSTTGSNYDKYFNNLSNFIGIDPEHGYPVGNAGDVSSLKSQMESLMKYANPNEAILTHMFFDNHDKPRLMHTLPLDMNLFLFDDVMAKNQNARELSAANNIYKAIIRDVTGRDDYDNISPKAVAVAYFFKQGIEKEYADNPRIKEKLLTSLQDLANGKKTHNSNPNYKRAQAFGVLPFEVTLRDVFKRAGVDDDKTITKILLNLMQQPMNNMIGLWETMNALMGTPTLFAGTEFAQTGYETSSKNMYLGNRGQIHHELKNEEGYKKYYDKISAISNLSQTYGMSALRSGTPISLKCVSYSKDNSTEPNLKSDPAKFEYFKNQIASYIKAKEIDAQYLFNFLNENKNSKNFSNILEKELNIVSENQNHKVFIEVLPELEKLFTKNYSEPLKAWPIYKYDDNGSKVLSVITNNGIKTNKKFKFGSGVDNNVDIPVMNEKKDWPVKSICLKDKDNNCPFDDNTIFKRKIYNEQLGKYIDEQEKYKIEDGELKTLSGKPLHIDDTVLYFYSSGNDAQNMGYMQYLYNGTH